MNLEELKQKRVAAAQSEAKQREFGGDYLNLQEQAQKLKSKLEQAVAGIGLRQRIYF